ncbi:MAG: hypothetical protein ACWA5U_00090 [bacterium]
MKTVQRPPQASLQIRVIGFIISVVIVFMAAANGIFTYAGAYLYLEEYVYAILFAVAVQFTIIISLLALPFVRGFGKFSLILVYTAALILSTLSAFTFIYNESSPEKNTKLSIDTNQKANITTLLSDVIRTENQALKDKQVEVAEYQRLVEEEAENGGRSGKGPGKGQIYYQKLDQYEQAQAELALQTQNYQQIQTHLNTINRILGSKSSDEDRQQLMVAFAQLRSVVSASKSQSLIETISQQQLTELKSPVERALDAMVAMDSYSPQLFVSVIWATIFDIIALFLGIIRYYLLRPDYSMLDGMHGGLMGGMIFLRRLWHLPQEAKLKYHRDSGVPINKHEVPLNSVDMQNFATKLLAGSQMATDNDSEENNNPSVPLQTLVSFLEPVVVDNDPHAVGIRFSKLEDHPHLKTLMAMLLQSKVFKQDNNGQAYILNSADAYAQKVMIFLRMGMKENPVSSDLVDFLTTEQRRQQQQITQQLNPKPQQPSQNDEADLFNDTSASKQPKNDIYSEPPNWGNIR